MKRFSFGVFFLLPVLAACGGGGSAGSRLPAVSAPLSTSVDPQAAEVQSDALQQMQPQYVPSATDLLYVANAGDSSITVYHYNASGDAAPIRVIAGSKTGIKKPGQLSEDAKGNLYVANSAYLTASGAPDPSAGILVFAHGANGNVAPIRKLAGKLTQIHAVEAMTVDQTTGKIFVFDEPKLEDEGASTYLRFPPDATGDEAPFAVSTVGYLPATELASDSTGKNLIEAGSPSCCTAANAGMQTLPKQFANGTGPSPVYAWSGGTPTGVADDPTTRTYLAMLDKYAVPNPGIYRFAEDTNGNFPVDGFPAKFHPAPVSVITSETCGGQLALGYLGEIFVAHTKGPCAKDAVYVYNHDATGDAAPLRILEGSATKLYSPSGIYEGQ